MNAADLDGFDVVVDAFGAWTPETLPHHSTSLKHSNRYASNMGKALDELRTRADVKWTYISPAGDFQADRAKTGKYILGGEELNLNSKGESVISYADYAVAHTVVIATTDENHFPVTSVIDIMLSDRILHSNSRKGNPYDNTCMESFHSVLKKEEIYFHTYQDIKEARRAIFEYIEGWYNRKRIYSAIGYLTPQQKEDKKLKKAA